MKTNFTTTTDRLNLLLVGNNPIEMGFILKKLQQAPGNKIITEIAFDLKSILERLLNFKPNFIVIDDNIGKEVLSETVTALAQDRRTKNIPITVLKNSNYEESRVSESFLDYVLKQNLSADSLINTLKNSLKFRRTQLYLQQAYNKRRTQLKSLAR